MELRPSGSSWESLTISFVLLIVLESIWVWNLPLAEWDLVPSYAPPEMDSDVYYIFF